MNKKIILTAAVLFLLPMTAAEVEVNNDIPTLSVIFQDQPEYYNIMVENTGNETTTVQSEVFGNIKEILTFDRTVRVNPGESENIRLEINSDRTVSQQFYTGTITLNAGETNENIPLAVRVTAEEDASLRLNLDSTSDEFRPSGPAGMLTIIMGPREEQTLNVTYQLRDAQKGTLIQEITREVTFENVKSFRQDMNPLEDMSVGDYYVQASTSRPEGNATITSTTTFSVTDPFWTPAKTQIALFLLVGGILIGGGLYGQRWYRNKKNEDARYVFPVDYSKLPNGENLFEMGKVAETEQQAHIDPADLTTHAIVSGSTGSGKSVTASVVAEEALEQDIPVVVFDPTAQWTGFVKELKDDNLLEHYPRFDMDKEQDPHPYRGVIKEINTEDPDINFEELRNPGEITVFTLNQLTTEEFDQAVRKIIDQIFEKEWEESPDLELLIVFDEVHRLLEEYGGQGGYKALEKGAREFRKWGIGIMMCSQVTADFKQAISGNIMTEIQMQTKSMEDIKRVEKKYGGQFSKRISSEDVGVGMIQNSNYNDGDPWFVDFRPSYHNPHKIPDQELEKYHTLTKELDKIKDKLSNMDDTKDKELELQLAENKLKEGRFKMAKMYINSLKDEMDIS